MSIRSNVEAIMAQIQGGDTELAESIKADAIAAIKDGQGSEAWETYMNRFGQTTEELARLRATDASAAVSEMDQARAALVDNGTCGATSTGFHLLDEVGDTLDEGLS